MADVGAIIAAGGRGRRLGRSVPKAFVTLAARPMFAWSLDAFDECESIGAIALVVPEDWVEDARYIVSNGGWSG